MAMNKKNQSFAYGMPNPLKKIFPSPIVAQRAPLATDKVEVGRLWVDQPNDDVYVETSIVNNVPTWINCGGGSGSFSALTVNPGDATITAGDLIVTAGDVQIGTFGRGVLQSNATGVLSTSAGTNGQLLVGSTGLSPAWATIASATLNITPGAGTLQIEYPGGTAASYVTTAGGPVVPLLGVTNVLGYDANITTDGTVANTIQIRLADSVTTVAALTAGVNLGMTSGICTITSNSNAANAIYLHANGGVNEQINIRSDQGTTVNSVQLISDVGGIALSSGLAAVNAINITALTGGIDLGSTLQTTITSYENAATAIYIHTTAGGMELRADGAAGEDLVLQASSSINLTSTENAAQSIYLHANGGANETIDIYSDLGTAVTALNLHADVGGITLQSGLASNDAINLTATSGGIDLDAALQLNITSSQAAADAIIIDASNAAGGIDLDYGTSGFTIDGGNGAFTLQTGTGAIGIGTDAVQHDVTVGNITGTTGIYLNSGTNGINLASTGTGDIIINSDDTLLLDADGVLELNSSAGIIGIGIDADNFALNLGTAGERTVTIGNVTGATSVIVNVGTGAADFAVSATDHTTRIGSTTGVSAFTAQAGTGAFTATAGGIFDVNAVGAVTIDSSAGTIGIGVDDIDQAINIGTVGERTVTIGNIVGTTGIALNAGTGGIDLESAGTGDIIINSDDTLLLDSDGVLELNSSGGVINIGDDVVNQAINIGGGGERTVTIGGITTASSVVVQCGTGPAYFGANATDHTTNVGSVTGVSATTIQAGTGGLTFSAAGIVDMTPVVASHASTVTIDANVGVATLTGFTTAAAGTEAITITNSICTANSAILVSVSNKGANDAKMTQARVVPGAGSFVVHVINNGAAALNGDIIITFWIIAA
jgi:hypothetical protein